MRILKSAPIILYLYQILSPRIFIKNHGIGIDKISLINEFISIKEEISDKKDRTKEDLGLEKNARIVFGCGTLDWRKGPDLFLETAQVIDRDFGINCKFYWIGGNIEQVSEYRMKVNKLNLENIIDFLGEKENPGEYFEYGDIFYLSSREDPYPLVCLEAAEHQLPIVCFENAGGIPDFVENDAGFVVPFEDTYEAAKKISYLIKNDEIRIKLGQSAREKLIKNNIDDIAVPEILSLIRRYSGIKPKLSIILPTYNHAGYLKTRLDSIFNQTFRDFELIILDDKSDDETHQIIEKLKF